MDKPNYKVGDLVEVWGTPGEVVEIQETGEFPVIVDFTSNGQIYTRRFQLDGRLESWHIAPCLDVVIRVEQLKVLSPRLRLIE
jgi:hypothetical protein